MNFLKLKAMMSLALGLACGFQSALATSHCDLEEKGHPGEIICPILEATTPSAVTQKVKICFPNDNGDWGQKTLIKSAQLHIVDVSKIAPETKLAEQRFNTQFQFVAFGFEPGMFQGPSEPLALKVAGEEHQGVFELQLDPWGTNHLLFKDQMGTLLAQARCRRIWEEEIIKGPRKITFSQDFDQIVVQLWDEADRIEKWTVLSEYEGELKSPPFTASIDPLNKKNLIIAVNLEGHRPLAKKYFIYGSLIQSATNGVNGEKKFDLVLEPQD